MAQLKDLIVNGATQLLGDATANQLKLTTLIAPTSSGSTTYGTGENGQVLQTGSDGIYWNTFDPLPAVTSADNDKVLTVVEGAWAVQSAGSGLPSVTSSDNGKVLTVISGEWTVQDPQQYIGTVNTMPIYDGGVS